MKWETPAYNDTRFGFEVTMYINNRYLCEPKGPLWALWFFVQPLIT